jgi:hypothetical protein
MGAHCSHVCADLSGRYARADQESGRCEPSSKNSLLLSKKVAARSTATKASAKSFVAYQKSPIGREQNRVAVAGLNTPVDISVNAGYTHRRQSRAAVKFPQRRMHFENNRGIAANDRTCNELGRVLQGQARSDLGDAGADCFRYFYGRPRAAPHSSLFRRADRLISSALVSLNSGVHLQTVVFIH